LANANMAALGFAVEQRGARTDDTWKTSVEPFRNNFVRSSTKQGLWLLLAAVCFLLLIACANVANLLLARGSVRQRELAIRSALGATNGAIARQLLIESLVLAFAGGGLGALIASIPLDAIVALRPAYTLPSETEITLSVPVLLFALGVCAMAGVLAGCAPAWQAARANLADAIKEGGRSIAGGRHLLRRALVVLEFALRSPASRRSIPSPSRPWRRRCSARPWSLASCRRAAPPQWIRSSRCGRTERGTIEADGTRRATRVVSCNPTVRS
jgi:putative ABC transport system permease protein